VTIGGPIRKDKIFFFGYYEGFRNLQGVTALTTMPSLQERAGNFAELCPEGFTHGFCNNPGEPTVQCPRQGAVSQQPTAVDKSCLAGTIAILSRTECGYQSVFRVRGDQQQ
jgi:hypothetical protein